MQDKKQRTQIVVLVVLVLACVGYAGLMMFGGKKAPASAPQAKTESAASEKVAVTPPEATAPVRPQTGVPGVLAAAPAAVNARDPFTPMMQTMVGPASVGTHAAGNSGRLPPINPVFPMGAGGTQSATAVTPAVDQFPQFALTGVITGSTNVAIMRLGESRYIVKEGQKIEGQYEVVSVTQEGVLLSRGGRSVFLKLGGDGNANKS